MLIRAQLRVTYLMLTTYIPELKHVIGVDAEVLDFGLEEKEGERERQRE